MSAAQVTPMGNFVVIALPSSSWRTIKASLTATEAYNLAVWLDATAAICIDESLLVTSVDVAEFFATTFAPTTPDVPMPPNVGATLARNNVEPTESKLALAIADARNRTASVALDMPETAELATALYAAAVAAKPPKEESA